MTIKQRLKLHRIEQVKMWINKLTAHDSYSRNALSPYNGDELDKLTLKEIDMLLDYITTVYHVSYQEAVMSHASKSPRN